MKGVRRMKYTALYKRCVALAALISCTCVPLQTRAAYATLQKGDTGDAVFKLEEALAMQGFFDAWPDSTYDDATINGVKAFQEAHGLKADGIAGDETQSRIFSTLSGDTQGEGVTDSTSDMPATLRDLSLNKQGNDVTSLQARLTELGYYTGRISGSYGKLTKAAVEAFQRANGLTADGIAGVRTQTKLYSTGAVPASAVSTGGTTVTDATGSAGVSYTTLKAGMSGDAVKLMQQKLKDLGYYGGAVTGSFGNVTWEAVRAFQRANGLTADGVAGPKTLAALYGTTGGTSSGSGTGTGSTTTGSSDTVTVNATLQVGSRGTDVKNLQTRLKELGYLTGSADGVFGTATETAVKAFQKANSLTSDGVAGPRTLNRINSSSAVAASGSSSSTVTNDTSTLLKYGMKNMQAIKDMQTRLTELKYYSGAITGNFGDLTFKAVKAFQSANGLTADGIAGKNTLTKLYATSAVAAGSGSTSDSSSTVNTSGWPSASEVQNVNWYTYIRPYYKAGTVMQIYDFENKLTWQCVMMSNGKHSDSQPRTAQDTEIMYKAFGNKNTWTPKAVWVKMPDGKVFIASMHNVPHLSGSIKDNNFDGHLCIHFPRNMDEAEETGPYAVSHQKAIIAGWEKTQAMIGK